LEVVVGDIDQNVCEHMFSVGAMDELEQIFSEGRLPSPPVWTAEGVVEAFNRTLTRGTLTGICSRVFVTVDLFPYWKPFTHKLNHEGGAFVLTALHGPCVAAPVDVWDICICQVMPLMDLPEEMALTPFGEEFPAVVTLD
jgi:hypothetical protein